MPRHFQTKVLKGLAKNTGTEENAPDSECESSSSKANSPVKKVTPTPPKTTKAVKYSPLSLQKGKKFLVPKMNKPQLEIEYAKQAAEIEKQAAEIQDLKQSKYHRFAFERYFIVKTQCTRKSRVKRLLQFREK